MFIRVLQNFFFNKDMIHVYTEKCKFVLVFRINLSELSFILLFVINYTAFFLRLKVQQKLKAGHLSNTCKFIRCLQAVY